MTLPVTSIAGSARIVRAFLVLHMDHGGGNLSTFTGKAVASGHATVYASMVADHGHVERASPRACEPILS